MNIKKRTETLYQSFRPFMVEVRGIEPPSESTPIWSSPSAAIDLGFPSPNALWRAFDYGSFIITGGISKL